LAKIRGSRITPAAVEAGINLRQERQISVAPDGVARDIGHFARNLTSF
jgi:hypothetical protein